MFAQIILLRRLPRQLTTLDYAVPARLRANLSAGQLVKVPFRSSSEFGIVQGMNLPPAAIAREAIKPLQEILVSTPLFSARGLHFFKELGERYHVSLGFLLRNALPTLNKKTIRAIAGAQIVSPPSSEQLALKLETLPAPRLHIYRTSREQRAITRDILKGDGQHLVLVPLLSDIAATLASLSKKIKARIQICTSQTTAADFRTIWQTLWSGEPVTILGTRRALSLPYRALKTIALLDEGNPLYKSWDMAPRFETRDAAELLARCQGAELHCVAHTPSVESWVAAKGGAYRLGAHRTLPRTPALIYNLAEDRKTGNRSDLAEGLVAAITKNVSGATFVHVARHGDAQYVACRDCGYVFRCPQCKTTLAAHDRVGQLTCRHCLYRCPEALTCPSCRGASFTRHGAGVSAIARELRRRLPQNRTIISFENTEKREKTLKELAAPGLVAVGPTSALPEISPADISLYVFADADSFLFIPEFQAASELWFLLRCAALKTKLPPVIQTSQPDHFVFKALRLPSLFYENEQSARRLFNYPPFCLLAKIFADFPSLAAGQAAFTKISATMAALTRQHEEVTINGPVPLFPPARRGRYYFGLFIKIKGPGRFNLLKRLLSEVPDSFKVDLQPKSLLGY